MFWKFDLNTTSHVDKLLDKEDVTLEELMDEDDVLQECKAQNRRLLDFLCQDSTWPLSPLPPPGGDRLGALGVFQHLGFAGNCQDSLLWF
uniref:Uncharacterized protein n=1 Tax=Cyanistes caeruleus TaxID=156563 RepID=A0A8C0UBC2_CYACU